jgi:RNA methyltransferase, TrmH family
MELGPILTSTANPRVRAAVGLRDRADRDATDLTIVDGARELRRALDAGVDIVEAFVCESLLAGEDARVAFDGLRALAERGIPVHAVSRSVNARLAFGERRDGLVAIIRSPIRALAEVDLPTDALVVVVEGVEKPGNLGAVLRSADGAGADAVIAASPRTDLANPNVIRASAGTVFSTPVASAPSAAVRDWLLTSGLHVVTARVDATEVYTALDLRGPVALVLGAEDQGLTATWDGPDLRSVRLPMHGVADSLNVSVSASILLYEARRQRDRHDLEAD